jgi:hypothetical protein
LIMISLSMMSPLMMISTVLSFPKAYTITQPLTPLIKKWLTLIRCSKPLLRV